MKKTDNFFVISNYNYDPRHLIEYCHDYIIYDQSSKQEYKKCLDGTNFISSTHSGHNISDYFSFFIDNYDQLPENIALIKGNIFPRHLSKDFFDKVYQNKFYTFLFQNEAYENSQKRNFFLFSENQYLEFNNSWFIKEHPHWYFQSYNELLKFVYKKPILPRYNLYSPGACYILTKFNVLKNSKESYENIQKLITYSNPVNPFPSEAHQIEWLSHLLYASSYEMHDYMNNTSNFDAELIEHCVNKKLSTQLLKKVDFKAEEGERLFNFKPKKLFNFIRGLIKPRILIIGIHSWKELYSWASAFPESTVLGTGILEPSGYDEMSTLNHRVSYIKTPFSSFVDDITASHDEFDLIIYEGYHLKAEVGSLSNVVNTSLKPGGKAIVSDVLTMPLLYMRKFSSFKQGNYDVSISCAPLGEEDIPSKYVILLERVSIVKKYIKYPINKFQTLYSNLHWVCKNAFDYVKKYMPV